MRYTATPWSTEFLIALSFQLMTQETLNGLLTSSSQRPQNTRHTTDQKEKYFALIGIKICDPTNKTDADLQLKRFNYRGRRSYIAFCHSF